MIQVDWSPDARKLRQFGVIAAIGFGLLALAARFELWIFGLGLGSWHTPAVVALAALGAGAGLCSAVLPRANLALYRGLMALSLPIGWVVSNLVLAAIFFGLFVPIGWALRLWGHDPLRRSRSDANSYWSAARPARSRESYFKQF